MNVKEEQELKKEFQLERIILFSDAVFAIIVTIMVIDLKLPETIREADEKTFTHELFKLSTRLLGYGISFFFVAMFWMRHVKLFGYIKDYNKSLLIVNLIFLFCVSLFPFAVTMITGFAHPGANKLQSKLGFLIYLFVIMICLFVFTLLTGYIIRNKEKLCFNIDTIEADLKWKALRANYVVIPFVLAGVVLLTIMNVNQVYIGYSVAIYGVVMGIITKRLYPRSTNNNGTPMLLRMFRRKKTPPKAE